MSERHVRYAGPMDRLHWTAAGVTLDRGVAVEVPGHVGDDDMDDLMTFPGHTVEEVEPYDEEDELSGEAITRFRAVEVPDANEESAPAPQAAEDADGDGDVEDVAQATSSEE